MNLANLDARLFQVHRAEDDWGAADIMSRFFYSLPPEMNKLWLNLDTTGKPVAVCNRILLAMLRIAGLPETTQASESEHLENKDFDGDEWREMAQRTARQAALRRSGPWCIFLNAWDEPGKSPLIVPTGKRDGWKSVKRIKQLAGFLTALTSAPRAADGGQTMPAVGIVLMIGAVHPLATALRIEASQTTFVPQQEEHLATTKTITEKVKQWLERPNDDFGLEKSTRPLLLQLIMRIQAPRYRAGLHRILYHLLRERFGDESESSNPSLPRLLTAKIDYDIGVLETCRLFKRKPGGFLWMHTSLRDSRELRKLLVRPENPGVVDLERFIARWYGRVLLASSEPLPAFLSVRHALEALKIFGELSEKKLLSPEEDRRLQPALGTTVRHAAIILRLNRCIIESKMAPLLARRFVESACERIREVQKVVAGKVECAAALDHLDAEHITLLQRLLEVQGDYRSAIHPPQASAPSPARRSSPSSPEGWSRAQSADAERYLIEGLGWMNLRCYGRARSAFHKVLVELIAGSAIPLLQTRHRSLPDLDLRQLWQGAWDWLKRYGADRRRTSLLIRCLRRVTYLLIHEAHVDWMIVGTHRAAPDSEVMRRCIALLDAAAKYAELGLELLRGLDPEDDFLIYYENARLRIHLAFARARAASWRDITPEERRAQMDFAEELLIDAQAYLDEWPLGGDTLTTAVLELRRAEIKLMRFWNGSTANGTDEFRELRMKLWRGRGEIDFGLIWPGFSLRIGVDTQLGPLADACVALRRTRELMSRHRKSVWWWQILLVLEAKAVEMALTAFAMHRTLDDGLAEEQQPLIGAWYAHLCEIVDHLGGQLGEELRLIGAPDPFQLARLAQSLPISRQLCTVIRTHRGGHSARWCLRFAERSERPLDEAVKAVTKLCLEQEPHDKNLDRNVVEYFQEAIPKSRFRKRWEAMRAPKRAGQRRR